MVLPVNQAAAEVVPAAIVAAAVRQHVPHLEPRLAQPGNPHAEAVIPEHQHQQVVERDIVDEWLTVLLVAIGTSIGLMLWRIVLRYYTLFFL